MSEQPKYWPYYDQLRVLPIDLIVNSALHSERNALTPEVLADFVSGCRTIYAAVQQHQPDIIFFPLRGASPLAWALEALEALEEEND